MVQKNLTVRRENLAFVQDHGLTLSSLIRRSLDWAVSEDRVDELPERDTPRRDIDAKRTCIKVEPRHQRVVERYDISLSRLADALIDQYRETMYGQRLPESDMGVTVG